MTDLRTNPASGLAAPGASGAAHNPALASTVRAAPGSPAPVSAGAVPFGPAPARPAVGASLARVIDALRPHDPWERYSPKSTRPASWTPPRVEVPAVTADPALRGMAYTAAADIHYDGDFVVPGSTNVAAHTTDVLAKPDWQQFIRDHLSFGPPQPHDPLRVFVSGLNADIRDNDHRGQVVAREMGFQFAELDNAISDQIKVDAFGHTYAVPVRAREWLMAALQRFGYQLPEIQAPPNSVRAALADLSRPNERLIDNLQRVIIAYIDSNDPTPLELWGYSEGTIVTYKAVHDLEARYLNEHMQGVPASERGARLAALKKRFNERCANISALFVGSAVDSWPTPIRRVDFFASADPVVRYTGPSRTTDWFRVVHDTLTPWARHDAEIRYPQPFNALDAHNLFAGGAPALSLYMEMNKVRTVKALYELWQAGTLKQPTLEQVKTRIRELHATDELWAADNLHRADPTPPEQRTTQPPPVSTSK